MLVICLLYGLNLSDVAFCAFLAEMLHGAGYRPPYANPDVWMIPAVKSNGMEYWEYTMCYVNDVLVISDDPNTTMRRIKSQFSSKVIKPKSQKYTLGLASQR